jgi:hypothetical protein
VATTLDMVQKIAIQTLRASFVPGTLGEIRKIKKIWIASIIQMV